MNRFLSMAVRCSVICAAVAPLHAQGMAKTPAKSAMAESQHSAMMSDSSKAHAAMKPKAAMAKDSGSAMKKPMAKDSGMAMGKSMEKPTEKPMAKDSGMMKKPQR